MLGIYPANYHEARDLFRQAAQDLGAHLENHVVLSGAEYGGDLTIDVAVVGVEDPTWSLVVSSGLHGVEGFFGSALQTAYLRQVQRQDVINSKGQLVLIHALNPFGFFDVDLGQASDDDSGYRCSRSNCSRVLRKFEDSRETGRRS